MPKVYVVAATTEQFDFFKRLVVASKDEQVSADDVVRAQKFNWQGAPIKRIIVLPDGWTSLAAEREAQVLRAYCARRSISLFNVTETKLAKFQELVEKEAANANR